MVELKIENENYANIKIGKNIASETVDDLEAAIDEAINKGCLFISLDMTGVQFINSSGLGIIIRYHRKLIAINGKLLLKNISEELSAFYQSMGLGKKFYIE